MSVCLRVRAPPSVWPAKYDIVVSGIFHDPPFTDAIRARIAFSERARIMAYGMGDYALKPRSGCSELYPLRGARIAVCGGRPYASADGVWTILSGLVTLAPKSPNSIRARITTPALG